MTKLKLYDYFRSSASYRVRIALNLKGLAPDRAFVHLRKDEQRAPDFLKQNPEGLVPLLIVDERPISQSLAIMEYLDEAFPEPPLLPKGTLDRAYVRSIALAVACDIHPLNNLRVLNYLSGPLHSDENARQDWYAYWIEAGLSSIEEKLARSGLAGRFCFGDRPGLADMCLVPQVFNAKRMNCDTETYPEISRIVANCAALPAFQAAEPSRQPDAE